MTHPMEAAARAMCDEWGYFDVYEHDNGYTWKRATRAAITAFLDAAEKDDAACAAIADAVDAEMARQTENAISIGRGPNYPSCGRAALAALKRIAEDAP